MTLFDLPAAQQKLLALLIGEAEQGNRAAQSLLKVLVAGLCLELIDN